MNSQQWQEAERREHLGIAMEVPGLREHLLNMTRLHRSLMIEILNTHQLLKQRGLVVDLELSEKEIALGNSGILLASLSEVKDKVDVKQVVESNSKSPEETVKTALQAVKEAPQSDIGPQPTPIEEAPLPLPTEIVTNSFNRVGEQLCDTLLRHLPADIIQNGKGHLKLKHYSDDLTTVPPELLLTWPTGIYRHRDDNGYQLLLNAGDSASGHPVLVVPRLHQLATLGHASPTQDQAFVIWQKEGQGYRVINDETPKQVFETLIEPFRHLFDTYLLTLGA